MGRVLLAALPAVQHEAYLARAELRPLTPRAIDNAGDLRAELQRIRDQGGWALVDQELEEGLRSIAAPIHDANGRTVAAVNLSAHASRVTPADIEQSLLPPLLQAAKRIEADLHDVSPSRLRA
jgi:IclR family pca regulon transcriptional regulator